MANPLEISLVQDRKISYEVRQGVAFDIPIEWLDADETPLDISDMTFLGQVRANSVEKNGTVVHTFSEAPDENNSYYDIDLDSAATTFYFSDELARLMQTGKTYYFEAKMILDGNPVDSVVIELKTVPDYAREVEE